ncbi:MAG TPA: hydroxymethylbilane synthase [Thermomicrobiales bacterium]|nr:hydroxymethylbilane synthase [Thermomicrobiales bacterium]
MSTASDQTVGTMRIGTRGSALAQIQAGRIKERLEAAYPALRCEIVIISTEGDRDKQTPLTVIGGRGVFAKDLQLALLDGRIDCAVHSLKDLPTRLPEGLVLAAVLERDDPRDVFLSPNGKTLEELPAGARVGTSSRRRMAEVRHARPDVEIVELRGNVDTRVRKVMAGDQYDGAVLAAAGIRRMGYADKIAEVLDLDRFTPSPGQAALGVECRADDAATLALFAPLADPETTITTGAERAFLREFGGGCTLPIGAHGTLEDDQITLRVMVASEDLRDVRFDRFSAGPDEIEALAAERARELQASTS